MSVSNSVLYNRIPKALKCSSSRMYLQPQSGVTTYTAGQTISFQIPTLRRGEFLNPSATTIKYKVRNLRGTGTDEAVRLDHNGASVISRLEIYHASNLVEFINRYNVLYSLMLDAQVSSGDHLTGLTASFGTDTTNVGAGQTIAADGSVAINMPLASSLIGLMASKYLPLCKLSSPLRVDLILATTQEAFTVGNAAGTITNIMQVFDVELLLEIVTLGEEAMAVVDMANSQYGDSNWIFSSKQFTHYTFSIASAEAGSAITRQIDARFSSVNGLLFAFRNLSTNAYGYSLSSRINPFTQLQLRLGSTYFPPKPVDTPAGDNSEHYILTQNYFHALGSLINYGSANRTTYNVVDGAFANNAARNNSYTNKHYLAINTEAYDKKSDQLYDGVSSINDSFYLNGTVNAGVVATIVGDVFVNHDVMFTIDPSGVLTRSM